MEKRGKTGSYFTLFCLLFSVVISSIGFGGGVVAIVQPILAQMNFNSYECFQQNGTAITQKN
jgi:hypothetical protein